MISSLITTTVQSQKDDLESIRYVILYFAKGKLPWQRVKAPNGNEKDRLVMEKKVALSVEALCEELPQEFAQYMRSVKSLRQGGSPDFVMLRKLLREVAWRHNMEYDNIFN